jgi:hypothetical protein
MDFHRPPTLGHSEETKLQRIVRMPVTEDYLPVARIFAFQATFPKRFEGSIQSIYDLSLFVTTCESGSDAIS